VTAVPLHVTNGDAVVFELAAAAGVHPDEVVRWRDVLHDGPVPAGLDTDELARVRAAHLAHRGWTTEKAALASMTVRDARLDTHPPDAEVVLWFEDDLYDALQLAQVADRLAGRPGAVSRVRLPHPPRGDLHAAWEARVPFTPTPDAFAALRAPDPRAWAAHAPLHRLLEELPDTRTGLSRLEREILEALAPGPLTSIELFHAVSAREQPPWLGDTALFAKADDLRPLVTLADGRHQLTPTGSAVLSGEATRPPHDHWIGGVHLAPTQPRWAWDAGTRKAVLLD
jgi:Domain of unknown function (DUF1835)